MKLYHTTLKKNLESIEEKGLLSSKLGIVYLSEKPNSWWQGKDYITLEINMDNFKGKLTTFNKPDLDEILCWKNIEPERITIYEVSYD